MILEIDPDYFVKSKFKNIDDAKKCLRHCQQFVNDFESRERAELWAWLKKEDREYEFEAIAECAEDYAGDQGARLRAGDAMDKIMEEFEQSRKSSV
jgi:hypothetical protein